MVGWMLLGGAFGGDNDDDGRAENATADTPEALNAAQVSNNADASNTTAVPAGESPIEGGSLTYLHPFPVRGFDPAISLVNSVFLATNFAVFDALAIESLSDGSTHLRLLESAETSDGTTWTLTLPPDVLFSDGTPLDAEAIKFNWARLADPATHAANAVVAQTVESMTAVDERTLEVILTEPNGQFVNTIATTALTWIGSPTAIQADPEGFNVKPVGAGAFVLADYAPETEVSFVRNPDYYGDVHLDELIIKIIPDESQRLSTLQSGGGDVMWTTSGVTAVGAEDAGYETLSAPRSGGYMLFFNMSSAPFDDLRARQAFAYAVDGAQMSSTLFGDTIPPATNLFIEGSPFFDAALDLPAADAERAQALFDELAEENGGALTVTLSYVNGSFDAQAEWIQTKIGDFDNVELSLDPVDPAEFQARYSDGGYQFGIHNFSFLDPTYLGQLVGSEGPLNYMQYSDPEMDELLRRDRAALVQEDRVRIIAEMQAKLAADLPLSPIHRTISWTALDPELVHGISLETTQSQYGIAMFDGAWVTT